MKYSKYKSVFDIKTEYYLLIFTYILLKNYTRFRFSAK